MPDPAVDFKIKENQDICRPVLDARDITVTYRTEKGPLHTVRNVNLQIGAGEIYGLVGESGSGKSTLARALVRYLPANGILSSGSVHLGDTDLLALTKAEMRKVWGARVTMVHQDPNAAINPAIPIGEQIAEVARIHLHMNKNDAKDKAMEMLNKVRMPDPESVARRYAHQLSGGMLQRVLIAIAMTTNPELLIMDEPTTALDVTTEAVILDLIGELMFEYNTAILYITHNLGVVARVCNRVGVLYAGEIMEEGCISRVFKNKLHPYTRGLLGCVPRVDANKKDISLKAIPGYIPRPDQLPHGCIFAPRCELVEPACEEKRPSLIEIESGHLTACRRHEELKKIGDVVADTRESHEEEAEYGELVLDARNIKKYFPVSAGLSSIFGGKGSEVKAVDDMSVRMRRSFTMGIVGESGCGKTTFARCIMGLEQATSGEIELEGELLPYSVAKRSWETLRKMQMVFQNPDASLNPQHPAGESVGRPLILLRDMSRKQVQERVKELFQAVNLPEDFINRLPHELSGGEKQRVAIARAFAADPILMVCDEPISSLDVSVQASLMNLLVDLQESQGTSYLFISHDLAAVRHLSDWIAVVYLGRLWEIGSAEDVFVPPCHPYTEALLSAIPIPDPDIRQDSIRLKGSVPSAMNIPSGCRFHTRCPRKIGPICENEEPPWQDAENYHQICCHIPLAELRSLQGEGLIKKPQSAGGDSK
ncbi:MAG: dipeptide ABC transporter ATP-binding protein [Dethiobacteria bacterium]